MLVSDGYYDKEGKPLDLMQWVALLDDQAYRVVAQEQIGEARVSTVWLGSNHRYGPGAPLIFETMIFGGPHDGYCDRYPSEAMAREGHAHALRVVRGEVEANR